MDELKKDVTSSIKDYFSTKISGFNFNDDTQMEDYINSMVTSLCDAVCFAMEDRERDIDAELEWWEDTHGRTYYEKRRYEEDLIYGTRYD